MGRLSKEKRDKIDEMVRDGFTQTEIAKKMGCSVSTVQRRRNALRPGTTGSDPDAREVYSNAFRIFENGGSAVDVVTALNVVPNEAKSLYEDYLSLNSGIGDEDEPISVSFEFEVYTKKGQLTEQGQMLLGVLDCTKAELMSKRSVLEDRITFLLSKVEGLSSRSELDELGALLDSLESEVEGLLSEENRVRERRRVVEEQRKQRENEKRFEWMVGRVISKGYSRLYLAK